MKQAPRHYMEKEKQLKYNLRSCRTVIYDIRYSDITAMCGIPMTTMQCYDVDSDSTTPFLTSAKKIADMYCTTIDRMCSYQIEYDHEKRLDMQINFINRLGPTDITECRDNLFPKIYDILDPKASDVCFLLHDAFIEIIKKYCKEGKYYKVEADPEICNTFTTNYNKLMSLCNISYKKISKICDISTATLTRLKQGAEPNLTTIIKLADYFGITISQFLSKNPEFDLVKIIGETTLRTSLIDDYDHISIDEQKAADKPYHTWLNDREAKEYAIKYLEKIK